MTGTYAITVISLTLIWCVLGESFSPAAVLIGVLVSTACVLFSHFYLPLYRVRGTSVIKLLTYPLFLLAQMYLSVFSIIRMIFTDAKADVIEVENDIESEFLQFLLSHSITLTPGTITLDLTQSKVTVLCLRRQHGTTKAAKASVRRLEKRLLLAQKTEKQKVC